MFLLTFFVFRFSSHQLPDSYEYRKEASDLRARYQRKLVEVRKVYARRQADAVAESERGRNARSLWMYALIHAANLNILRVKRVFRVKHLRSEVELAQRREHVSF